MAMTPTSRSVPAGGHCLYAAWRSKHLTTRSLLLPLKPGPKNVRPGHRHVGVLWPAVDDSPRSHLFHSGPNCSVTCCSLKGPSAHPGSTSSIDSRRRHSKRLSSFAHLGGWTLAELVVFLAPVPRAIPSSRPLIRTLHPINLADRK